MDLQPPRLRIDAAVVVAEIAARIRTQVGEELRRSGCVVALSGGIDSAVCAGLAVRALGPKRVLGIAMPERESEPAAVGLAAEWAERLGISFAVEEITTTLDACGCYARRDAAIRRVVPEYSDGWRAKLIVDGGEGASGRISVAALVVRSPNGDSNTLRLPAREVREIVAATNFKQRVRTMLAYHHADRLHYAVVGTPNRLEYDQGFFVKGGDGLADLKPIAHLYKSQVYQLADELGVPAGIRYRVPTTDTYSLPQTQEEFFFALPLESLDVVLHAIDHGGDATDVAQELGISESDARRAIVEAARRRDAARYLHSPALLAGEVHVTDPSLSA